MLMLSTLGGRGIKGRSKSKSRWLMGCNYMMLFVGPWTCAARIALCPRMLFS